MIVRRSKFGILACALSAALLGASSAQAVPLLFDFDTEGSFTNPGAAVINGQIVDSAFDAVDLETFSDGSHSFTVGSTLIGGGSGHLGAAIFDSDLAGTADPDLEVNTGNLLILQERSNPSTSLDGTVGLIYDTPDDNAVTADQGSIVLDFLNPEELLSITLVDINGGVDVTVTLTDLFNNTREYFVPTMWTKDFASSGPLGYHPLDLQALGAQSAEPGATGADTPAPTDTGAYDPTQVVQLDIAFIGSSPSGGIDSLTLEAPEPATGLLLLASLSGLLAARRLRRS